MKRKKLETAILGSGCFWCTEAIFKRLKGVESVVPGYAGGQTEDPSYQEVGTGSTNHAEVIKIEFDPKVISFDTLLDVFFHTHNPTALNRQGMDTGSQYRSVVLYTSKEQKRAVDEKIKELASLREFKQPIVTEVKAFSNFYTAEEYHHDYYQKNQSVPYCQITIRPKLEKLEKKYAALMKGQS